MRIIILMMLLFVTSLSTMAGYSAESHQGYRLFFPKINLSKEGGERIEEIHLSVACGHIEAITKIPDNWNIQLVRMISGVERLHASAGHGGSRLSGIQKLNGAIRITVRENECFDVSATILISGENIRQVDLPRSKLKLLPWTQKRITTAWTWRGIAASGFGHYWLPAQVMQSVRREAF